MVFNIFVDDKITNKTLVKKTNKFLESSKKKKKNFKYTVFAPFDDSFVIAVYDRRIRISITDKTDIKSINLICDYLSSILKYKTVTIRGSDLEAIKNLITIKDVKINIV